MRGWQVRTLGPGADEVMDIFQIASQSGDSKLELDLELRQKLFWKIEGALFAEAGNVWDFASSPDEGYDIPWIETAAADWGIGLRLNLNFILLRLDWGMKIYEPSRKGAERWVQPAEWIKSNGSAVHFGVGYPF